MNRTVLQGSFDTGTIQELETMGRTLTDEDVQRIAKAVWDAGGQGPVQALDDVSTADLVHELSQRADVRTYNVRSTEQLDVLDVFGPSIILVITNLLKVGGAIEIE